MGNENKKLPTNIETIEHIPDYNIYKIIYKNGDRYAGQLTNFYEPTGVGVMNYANGDIYRGKWSYGRRNGKGVLTYANGDVYSGEWHNDKKIEG